MKGEMQHILIRCFCSTIMLHMEVQNLQDVDVISACMSKNAFMKAPNESGVNHQDFPKKVTEWIATAGKRCTE